MLKEKEIKIKTYEDWGAYQQLDDYLKVGDIVDEEMVEHFLNVLPPLMYTHNYLQVSEACDFRNGKNTYTTFEKVNGQWFYRGDCNRGKTIR